MINRRELKGERSPDDNDQVKYLPLPPLSPTPASTLTHSAAPAPAPIPASMSVMPPIPAPLYSWVTTLLASLMGYNLHRHSETLFMIKV